MAEPGFDPGKLDSRAHALNCKPRTLTLVPGPMLGVMPLKIVGPRAKVQVEAHVPCVEIVTCDKSVVCLETAYILYK